MYKKRECHLRVKNQGKQPTPQAVSGTVKVTIAGRESFVKDIDKHSETSGVFSEFI